MSGRAAKKGQARSDRLGTLRFHAIGRDGKRFWSRNSYEDYSQFVRIEEEFAS
jgi:hypothetical protein